MNDILFMAVDLGTSFIKAGIYNDAGVCLAGSSEPVRDSRPVPGVFLQNGIDIYNAVLRWRALWESTEIGRILPRGPVLWIPGIQSMHSAR